MFQFNYVKAKSLADAAALLKANPEAKLMSGGMTLLPTLKQGLAQPSHLVDIGALAELAGIEVKGDTLVILEAMKMELPLRASADAVVSAVHCHAGELVKADTVLIELA